MTSLMSRHKDVFVGEIQEVFLPFIAKPLRTVVVRRSRPESFTSPPEVGGCLLKLDFQLYALP